MCKSDYHESAWNCVWTNRYFRYIHWEKIPEILLFPLLSYTRAKSRKYVIFATSNGYSSNTKERESQVHTANWFFYPKCIVWTLVSARNMQVTLGPKLFPPLAVKIVKSSNHYCSLVWLGSHLKLGTHKVHLYVYMHAQSHIRYLHN